MPLTATTLAELAAALPAQGADVAEALKRCFGNPFVLEIGTSAPLSEVPSADLETPGLVVQAAVDGSAVLLLLPESLPLPDSYATPDSLQAGRLQALALEWSQICLPPSLTAESCATTCVPSLWLALQTALTTEALAVPVQMANGRLWIVIGVLAFRTPPEPATASPDIQPSGPPRIARLLSLPVVVSVQLAQKRIELGTLRGLAPGSLVTFDKSCEDLLDLFVNNRLFCRGEAVKVGEKFGLKINEVGPVEERVSAVIDRHARD